MPEERQGGDPGQRETQGRREILDLDKYGALYGRFLLASQAKTPQEAANIIDPTKPVEFNLTADTLDKRNYNLVAETSSLNEREKQWEKFEPSEKHPTAYSQWQKEFTGFMTGITDWKREEALRIIMPNLKKPADFTKDNANQLFTDFCKDGSNITNFIERVTTNSVNKRNIIDAGYLKELLPHLEWIASGLFGRQTASDVVTRLIELESEIHNNSGQVIETFNFYRGRIDSPTNDEKRVLGVLYNSLPVPQAKTVPTQEPKLPIPTIPAVPKPAPVALKSDEDKDKPPPSPPPVSQANGPRSAAEALRKEMEAAAARMRQQQNRGPAAEALAAGANTAAEESEREMASLRDLFAAPHPPQGITAPPADLPSEREKTAGETEENGKISSFEDELIKWEHGDCEIRIEKGNIKWHIYFYIDNKHVDYSNEGLLEDFDLSSALKEFEDKGLEPDTANKIYQALAKSFLNGLKANDPVYVALLKGIPGRISLDDPNNKNKLFFVDKNELPPPPFTYSHVNTTTLWYLDPQSTTLTEDDIKKLDPETISSLNVSIGKTLLETWIKSSPTPLETWIKSSPTPTAPPASVPGPEIAGPKPEQTTAAENIINMEGIFPDNLPKKLNELLKQKENELETIVILSPNQVKEYMFSALRGRVQGGTIKVNEKGDEITIEGIQINMPVGGKVTLNLTIGNRDSGYSFSRISADIQEYRGNWIAKKLRGKVEDSIKDIDSAVKEHLNEMMSPDNSSWRTGRISIAEGKVRVEFNRTRSRASSGF